MKYLILNPAIARFHPSEGGNKYPTHPSPHPTQFSQRSPAEAATSYPLPQFSQRAPAEVATSYPLTQYSQRTPAAEAKGSLNPLTYVRNIISAVSLKRPRGVVSSKQELSKQTKNESR